MNVWCRWCATLRWRFSAAATFSSTPRQSTSPTRLVRDGCAKRACGSTGARPGRCGVRLPRNCQVSLMRQLDERVVPLVRHLKMEILGSGYVQLDATAINVELN